MTISTNLRFQNVFKLLIVNVLCIIISVNIKAQQFYNFEEFFDDSSFILAHNILTVTAHIPELMQDTTQLEFLPYQKLCFNPYGKLGQYEYNLTYIPRKPKGFVQHFYNKTARCFKSYRYNRADDGRDSLREVIAYDYDEVGKLVIEEHHQIYISEFNEYSINYEWFADTLRVQFAEGNKMDSMRLDNQKRIVMYSANGIINYPIYDEITGRRVRMKRFIMDDEAKAPSEISECVYIYTDEGRLLRIETTGRETIFLYNDRDLPISSQTRDRATGRQIGWQVFYEYEFRR